MPHSSSSSFVTVENSHHGATYPVGHLPETCVTSSMHLSHGHFLSRVSTALPTPAGAGERDAWEDRRRLTYWSDVALWFGRCVPKATSIDCECVRILRQ